MELSTQQDHQLALSMQQQLESRSFIEPAPATNTGVEAIALTAADSSKQRLQELLLQNISRETRETSPKALWDNMTALRNTTKLICVRMSSNDAKRMAMILPTHFKELESLLWAYYNVDIKSEPSKRTDIKTMLDLIAREKSRFPSKYVEIAKALIHVFEVQNWGEDAKIEDGAHESLDEPEEHRKKKEKITTSKPTSLPSGQTAVTRHPNPAHRIFGAGGIMDGILITRGMTKAYSIDPNFAKKAHNVYGQNGLTVGSWWPMQIAALRDGAHGSKMGGISGTETDGCRSILISKMYEGVDQDRGDEVLYSSTQKDSLQATQDNAGTKALLRSQETQRPVRVLRKQSGWAGAPSVGIRYDGLYKVISSKPVQKGVKEYFYQFHLVRLPNQSAIDRLIPTARQVLQHAAASEGY